MGFQRWQLRCLYQPRGARERLLFVPCTNTGRAAAPSCYWGLLRYILQLHRPLFHICFKYEDSHSKLQSPYPGYCCLLRPRRCSSAALAAQATPFHPGIQAPLFCREIKETDLKTSPQGILQHARVHPTAASGARNGKAQGAVTCISNLPF